MNLVFGFGPRPKIPHYVFANILTPLPTETLVVPGIEGMKYLTSVLLLTGRYAWHLSVFERCRASVVHKWGVCGVCHLGMATLVGDT